MLDDMAATAVNRQAFVYSGRRFVSQSERPNGYYQYHNQFVEESFPISPELPFRFVLLLLALYHHVHCALSARRSQLSPSANHQDFSPIWRFRILGLGPSAPTPTLRSQSVSSRSISYSLLRCFQAPRLDIHCIQG
jgi:hypothetical protein